MRVKGIQPVLLLNQEALFPFLQNLSRSRPCQKVIQLRRRVIPLHPLRAIHPLMPLPSRMLRAFPLPPMAPSHSVRMGLVLAGWHFQPEVRQAQASLGLERGVFSLQPELETLLAEASAWVSPLALPELAQA